jgi:hypothetical protein
MDPVPAPEYVRFHPRIPMAYLMPEMNASFKKLLHADNIANLSFFRHTSLLLYKQFKFYLS